MYRLDYDRYEEIKTKIVSLFREYKINTLPIDCFGLALKMGFKLTSYSMLSEDKISAVKKLSNGDAYTVEMVESGEKIIFYDDLCNLGRQRFTILHEIGHFVLGHREESELAKSEADFFAKYAIAPPPLINYLEIDNYVDLAEQFGTSEECAYYIMESYIKWLQYGPENYTDYEVDLLNLFNTGDYKSNLLS